LFFDEECSPPDVDVVEYFQRSQCRHRVKTDPLAPVEN
jgi:hypothetical protein